MFTVLFKYLNCIYFALRRTRDRFYPVHESAIWYAVFHLLVDASFHHDVLPGPEQRGIYTTLANMKISLLLTRL